MIEKVVNRKNMLKAYKQVVSNKGSAGVDGMSVKGLSTYLKENRDKIVTAVCNGKYLPQPILGVEIPKENGKKRLLGIPTVTDRLLQQAVNQVIAPKFELEFKEHIMDSVQKEMPFRQYCKHRSISMMAINILLI